MSDKKIYQPVRGWAPLRCSLQSVPPPAADNQGVWGSEGGGGGGWPRPGPLLFSSSPCHFHVSFPPISDKVCPSRFSRLYIFSSPFLLLVSASPFLSTLSSTNYLRRWRSSSSEFALRIATSPVLCIRCALQSSYPLSFLFEIRESSVYIQQCHFM